MWADDRKEPAEALPRVTTREAAVALVDDIRATMRELAKILEVETAHLRAGRIRDGLAQEERKSALTSHYLVGLEALKANAIALARFVPDGLQRLKEEHGAFARTLETNQVVLATARSVSESLVRSLSAELEARSRTSGYGPRGTASAGYGGARAANAGSILGGKTF